MKIQFGTTLDNVNRAMFVGFVLFMFVIPSYLIHYKLDDAQDELNRSHALNITPLDIRLFCKMSFDDSLCSAQLTKIKQSKYCLTDNFLFGSRMFIIISFVLYIVIIHDLFSFSGKYVHFIVFGLWIASAFIIIIITNGIYQDSCFHLIINRIFCPIDMILFSLMSYDIAHYSDRDRLARKQCTSSNEKVFKKTNNDLLFWQNSV
jgi:hypothetical protein